jgi:hypothetical protein
MTAKRLYAQGTTVSVAKSRVEIETLVTRHGATSFASGYEGTHANILFKMKNRRVRFELQLVEGDERENMRRWRCLAALLKAKLSAVEDVLRVALETEQTLRAAASLEWACGNTVGPMSHAHNASIDAVLDAAKALLEKAAAP